MSTRITRNFFENAQRGPISDAAQARRQTSAGVSRA